MAERNIIKIARATRAELELVKDLLHDYEILYATDEKTLGNKDADGNLYFSNRNKEIYTEIINLVNTANKGKITTTVNGSSVTLVITDVDYVSLAGAVLKNVGNPVDAGDAVNYSTYLTGLATKEPTIQPGTTNQYYRGDKQWAVFPAIPVLPTIMTTTEGEEGTSETARLINALNLKDIILYHSPAGARPASDVYAWAKADTKPTYSYSEITGAKPPTDAQKNSDITKAEIEAKLTGIITTHNHDTMYLKLTGGALSGALDLGNNKITNLANPTNPGDAVNYTTLTNYVANNAPGTNLGLGTRTVNNLPITSSTGTGIATLPAATGTLAGIVTAGTQVFGGEKTFLDSVIVEGDLTVKGQNFIVESTTVRTADDVIELRHEATVGLASPAGIAINHYNTLGDTAGIVMNNDGELRVGKITIGQDGSITDDSEAQPILTRDERAAMSAGGILSWDAVNSRAITRTAAQLNLTTLAQFNAHVNDTDNPHGTTKADVGLGNVDNTADADKEVLSATKLTTARDIVIGNRTQSFDGTAGISFSLAQIGAEPVFSKNTAFNKNFGTTAGTVAEGNHTHGSYDRASAVLTGANVFSNIVVTNGIVTNIATRALTKANLGLGSVENYGIATEAEAKAGAANNKYMTPLRTFDAISVAILDGGDLSELI